MGEAPFLRDRRGAPFVCSIEWLISYECGNTDADLFYQDEIHGSILEQLDA